MTKKEVKVEAPVVKAPKKKSEGDLLLMVDLAKSERAKAAALGRAKPGSAEQVLFGRFNAEFEGDALVLKIYEGLGGLLNAAQAKKNREVEAEQAKKKRSR